MKRFILFLTIITSAVFAHSVMADGYWGVKGGIFQFKNSGVTSPINAGVFLGVDVAEIGANSIAIEGDINMSLIEGKSSGINFGLQTTALYVAMRTGSENFFKVKLGSHNTTTSVGSSNSSHSDLSYGIGIGFDGYEIEYTILKGQTDDVSLLSVGYHF